MASWMVGLPWVSERPYDVLDFYAGVARVSRLATACGFNACAYDIKYDTPEPGESYHSGRAKRSCFDINGEGGFLLLCSTSFQSYLKNV